MKLRNLARALALATVAACLTLQPATAPAYAPLGGVLYQLGDAPCLKGRGNCVIYAKSAQLTDGTLVAAFERSTVPASGTAVGQTIPIHASDDHGTTWRALSEVPAPAFLSDDPAFAKYTSNWTNPFLYVLPEAVGDLPSGTLLLASIVSGEDHYYVEQKALNPNWVPSNDGDRADLALALFASADGGVTWEVLNVIAEGGWQGRSAGAIGQPVATANTHRQVDPIWEPYLMVHDGALVAYYSDENEYISYDPTTGVLTEDPDNDTAPDPASQVLVHKTWDGRSASWSAPVLDVGGRDITTSAGTVVLGGGRPGMTTIVPTADGRWFLTYEYWAGGSNVRYKLADDPLRFFADGDRAGLQVTDLPVDQGSGKLSVGGSPVTIRLPDGRLVYNASGSGSVWVSESGLASGPWKQFLTNLGGGYSRNLQYVDGTGRLVILQGVWGGATAGSTIRYGEVDLGNSDGAYYQLVNRKTGQVMGTGSNTNDARFGNADAPDIVLEAAGATSIPATQTWHVVTKPDGGTTLLNGSGGRSAAIWTGQATVGQRLAQWVDDISGGHFRVVPGTDGYVKLQAARNAAVFVTGATAGGPVTLQNAISDGSQDWLLVPVPGEPTATPTPTVTSTVTVTGTATATATATATTTATATVTSTATATATITTTATQTATEEATATATHSVVATVTVPPTATATVTASAPAGDRYSTPGFHLFGDRWWYTECEPYGGTTRCRTDIWATQVSQVDGRFVQRTGWFFNNLTYLPEMTRAEWGEHPFATTGEWTVDGRQWRTECGTPATGPDGCRSYIWARYITSRSTPTGLVHQWTSGWLLNHMVSFKAVS